jgi:Transglycosylase-like domain
MARLVVAMTIGVVVGLVAGAALGIRASEPTEDIMAAAAEAGVDPVLLEGAMHTVGQPDPRTYLRYSGELPWPAPSRAGSGVGWGIWQALAACESGGRWHIDAYHDGGLQFLPSTWLAYGGGAYARYAWQATPAQQIEIAVRVQRAAGWGQWPACSRRLGLR